MFDCELDDLKGTVRAKTKINLPAVLSVDEIKLLHNGDLEKGYGEVYLPQALGRKYPNAGREWKWQYVFPSGNLAVDPRSGKVRRHHISDRVVQKILKQL